MPKNQSQIEIGQVPDTSPLYNSRITKTYLEYIKNIYPDLDIDSILEYAGMTRYEVEDQAHWFSQDQADRFQEILVKKTGNPDIAKEYKKIEAAAEKRLLSMLPEELHEDFEPFLVSESSHPDDAAIVKQADCICAYLKCLEELSAGNHEYALAKKRLDVTLKERYSQEMEYFLQTFAPSFELTLDEIS